MKKTKHESILIDIWRGFEFKLDNDNWCCVLNEGSNDQIELYAMPAGDGTWRGQISLTHDDEEYIAYGDGRGFKSCLNSALSKLRHNDKWAEKQAKQARKTLDHYEDQHSQLNYLLLEIGGGVA